MKRIKTAMTIGGILLVAGAVFTYLNSSGQQNPGQDQGQGQGKNRIPQVRVVPASRATVSRTLDLTGSVEPVREAQLASPAEGPVQNLRVREGDRVRAGEVLLTIGRKRGVDALIESLREELKKEEDDLGRIRQLVESEAIPGEQRDHAEARVEKIRAELIRAEEAARDYTVVAPWNGVVSHLNVQDGQFVPPRTPLIEMYDSANLVVRAAVPEKYATEIRKGMRLDVKLDAYPDRVFNALIVRVYPYLDQRTRTRILETEITERVELLPGMFARLNLRLETVENATVVPAEAVVITPKGKMVFLVENGKTVGRPVETGIEEGSRIQIVSGIHEGETVIVSGNEKLKDGLAVNVSEGKGSGKGKTANMDIPSAEQKRKAGGGQ